MKLTNKLHSHANVPNGSKVRNRIRGGDARSQPIGTMGMRQAVISCSLQGSVVQIAVSCPPARRNR